MRTSFSFIRSLVRSTSSALPGALSGPCRSAHNALQAQPTPSRNVHRQHHAAFLCAGVPDA